DLINPDGTIDYLNKESTMEMAEPRVLQPNIYTEEYRSTFRIKLLELTNQKEDIMRYDVFDGFGYLTDSKNDTILINQ
ncbi:MAG: hypothetical protein KDC69_00005, partial [Flavobacteriaceae bacterium]|nr:hypothetical protein [Flavobacteriaceae bacterium]